MRYDGEHDARYMGNPNVRYAGSHYSHNVRYALIHNSVDVPKALFQLINKTDSQLYNGSYNNYMDEVLKLLDRGQLDEEFLKTHITDFKDIQIFIRSYAITNIETSHMSKELVCKNLLLLLKIYQSCPKDVLLEEYLEPMFSLLPELIRQRQDRLINMGHDLNSDPILILLHK